jgi:ABC-type multidrug transport system fused ATPase/permease subunit
MFRLFDPSSGQIRAQDIALSNLDLESYRSQIGVMPQDTTLFHDSIMFNIGYANPNASAEEIFEAAKRAQLHDWVLSLPSGYETRVGDRGLMISGKFDFNAVNSR